MSPHPPKKYSQLSREERSIIASMFDHLGTASEIAQELGRSVSTITRELKRNQVKGAYISAKAQLKSYQRRYWVTKPTPHFAQPAYHLFADFVEKKLLQKYPWSPEAIVNRWKLLYPNRVTHPCLSAPTLYTYLYRYRPDLCRRLLTKREKRKKYKKNKTPREIIKNRVWIDDRPAEIGTIPHTALEQAPEGHWEGDTLGSKTGETDTLVGLREKRSRYIVAKHILDRGKKRVTSCVTQWRKRHTIKTVTLDSGVEFRDHEHYGCSTYFCHPYSSWEKGQIENGMRLLRRKYPKGTSLKLSKKQEKELQQFVKALNNTPMECLGWKTPQEVLRNQEPSL